MTFLLDTNVLSELRKDRPHGGLLEWYNAHPIAEYAIPSVAIYEIQAGAERTRANDPLKAAQIESWLNQTQLLFKVIDFDASAAQHAAKLMVGRSLDLLEDAMIAATAITKSLTLATQNTKDFKLFGVRQVNPFIYRAM